MKIINLWAGPGAGKSTTASGLFFLMKQRGINVELVSEYAKELTWDQRHNVLCDQLYVTAKQNRRLSRLVNHNLDFVITDSPLLLGIEYSPPNYLNNKFEVMLFELWDQYDNLNFFLERNKPYNPIGRNQSEKQARQIDENILELLKNSNINFHSIVSDSNAPLKILEILEL